MKNKKNKEKERRKIEKRGLWISRQLAKLAKSPSKDPAPERLNDIQNA